MHILSLGPEGTGNTSDMCGDVVTMSDSPLTSGEELVLPLVRIYSSSLGATALGEPWPP
jgi:hypothetical protein